MRPDGKNLSFCPKYLESRECPEDVGNIDDRMRTASTSARVSDKSPADVKLAQT